MGDNKGSGRARGLEWERVWGLEGVGLDATHGWVCVWSIQNGLGQGLGWADTGTGADTENLAAAWSGPRSGFVARQVSCG